MLRDPGDLMVQEVSMADKDDVWTFGKLLEENGSREL